MDRVSVCLAFDWRRVGDVQLSDDGKLVFPRTTSDPGLYRFDLESSEGPATYIGETDQIARRLQHYRTPGPSQKTNIRLNELMRSMLSEDHRITAAVVTGDITISLGSEDCRVDLNRKLDRVLLEHAAIFQAYMAGVTIVNA